MPPIKKKKFRKVRNSVLSGSSPTIELIERALTILTQRANQMAIDKLDIIKAEWRRQAPIPKIGYGLEAAQSL